MTTSTSTSALDVVQGVYAAFARGDLQGFFALLAPDVRWHEADGHPYGGVHVGTEAIVKNVITPLGMEWENFTAVNHEYVAQGDTVVSIGTYRGTYRKTGRTVEVPNAVVWKVKNGKVQSLDQYTDTAKFQDAVR